MSVATTADTDQKIAEAVTRSTDREAQGFPPTVEDEEVLQRVVALLEDSTA